jgi:hypothetical protein
LVAVICRRAVGVAPVWEVDTATVAGVTARTVAGGAADPVLELPPPQLVARRATVIT